MYFEDSSKTPRYFPLTASCNSSYIRASREWQSQSCAVSVLFAYCIGNFMYLQNVGIRQLNADCHGHGSSANFFSLSAAARFSFRPRSCQGSELKVGGVYCQWKIEFLTNLLHRLKTDIFPRSRAKWGLKWCSNFSQLLFHLEKKYKNPCFVSLRRPHVSEITYRTWRFGNGRRTWPKTMRLFWILMTVYCVNPTWICSRDHVGSTTI